MGLFDWLKKDPAAKGWVPGRAVAIPHYPRSESRSNVVENSSSANSVSTLSVTVRPLQPGDLAEEVGGQYPRLKPVGSHKTTNLPDGCQRLHVNVPNWVHLLVRQEGWVHRLHTEIPVWIDPASGQAKQIDKEKLVQELERERERATRIFDTAGMNGRLPETDPGFAESARMSGMEGASLAGDTVMGRGAAPGGPGFEFPFIDEFADISNLGPFQSAAEALKRPPTVAVTMEPVEGMDFETWVGISAYLAKRAVAPAKYDEAAQGLGCPPGRWSEIDRVWQARIRADWQMGARFGEAYEKAMKALK